MCINTNDSELNEARILLAPVNIFLSVAASLIYLTVDLFQNFALKFVYSTGIMVVLGFIMFFLQNFIFSGSSKGSVSFIITPMLTSFLVPIHVALLCSYLSDGINGYVTQDNGRIVEQWIRDKSMILCLLFMMLSVITTVFQSFGSLFSWSCSLFFLSISGMRLSSSCSDIESSKTKSGSIEISPEIRHIWQFRGSHYYLLSLLTIAFNAISALIVGVLFDTRLESAFSIFFSNGVTALSTITGVFFLTSASGIETTILTFGSGYMLTDLFGSSTFLVASACSFFGSAVGACVIRSAQSCLLEGTKDNSSKSRILGCAMFDANSSTFSPQSFASVLESRVMSYPVILIVAYLGASLRSSQSSLTVICAITLSSFLSALLLFDKDRVIEKKKASNGDDIHLPLLAA